MPAQYPGNATIKAARAATGGGFESAIESAPASPPSAPPVFTTTAGSTSITANVTEANGATSYNIRVAGGTAQSGTTVTGLNSEQIYSVELQGMNSAGTSAWSAGVSETTTAPSAVPTGNIVTDGFESADMSSPGYVNFNWGGNNSTSVVTMDSDAAWCATTGAVAVYNNGQICNAPPDAGTTDWSAQSGRYSLRFRYAAGNQSSAEQDYEFVAAPATEIWLAFDLRVPVNFIHEAVGGGSDNNKFFRMYPGSTANSTGTLIGAEFRSDGAGGSDWYLMGPRNSTGFGEIPNPGAARAKLINHPADQGRWMRIWIHYRMNSAAGVEDGLAEAWKAYIDNGVVGTPVKQFDFPNQNFPAESYAEGTGWTHGYLLGYHNSGYAADTEFLMDNVAFGTEAMI